MHVRVCECVCVHVCGFRPQGTVYHKLCFLKVTHCSHHWGRVGVICCLLQIVERMGCAWMVGGVGGKSSVCWLLQNSSRNGLFRERERDDMLTVVSSMSNLVRYGSRQHLSCGWLTRYTVHQTFV